MNCKKGCSFSLMRLPAMKWQKYAAEICVVQFNDDAECLLDFGSIERQQVPQLKAKGDTHMGEAVNLALDLLEKRKNEYKIKA